jgi:hypothetical protein
MPMQPRLHRKQGQDRKRHHADSLVRNCCVRQQSKNDERRKRNPQAVHSIPRIASLGTFSPRISHRNSWCTGKDSNLRTSLGGTDLQSVGFNHSPTCAETAQASAPHRSSCPDSPLWGYAQTRNDLQAALLRQSGVARTHSRTKKSLHFGKIPKWSAFGKLALLHCFRCPAG